MKKSNTSEGTAIETFRNKLRATPCFTDKTAIEKEFSDPGADYIQQFVLKLYLEKPVAAR